MRYCAECGTKLTDIPADKIWEIIQDCGVRHKTILNDPRSGGRDILYTYPIVQEGVAK